MARIGSQPAGDSDFAGNNVTTSAALDALTQTDVGVLIAAMDATDPTDPDRLVTLDELRKSLGGQDLCHATDTAVSPATGGQPTTAEIQTVVTANSVKNRVVYYTGDDVATPGNATYTYAVDGSGTVVATGTAGGGGATNLTYTAGTRTIASDTGTDAVLPEVVGAGDSGLMTGTDKTKLDGIETGADVTDATNVDAAGATMNTDSDVFASGTSMIRRGQGAI